MAIANDDILARLSALLDLVEGLDIVSRNETSPEESGVLGTHEPCLGHNRNKQVWGYCPACGGTGFVRSRHGSHDLYVTKEAARDVHPTPTPPRIRSAGVAEPVRLTAVERAAEVRLRHAGALHRLQVLLDRAPDWVLGGVPGRETLALSWIAKRMAYIPDVR